MRPTRFLAVYFVVSLGLIGLALGGWWTLLLPVFAFVCIPTAELFLHGETSNLDPADEPEVLANPWFDRVVYGLVPIQWAAILLLLASALGSRALRDVALLFALLAVVTTVAFVRRAPVFPPAEKGESREH